MNAADPLITSGATVGLINNQLYSSENLEFFPTVVQK